MKERRKEREREREREKEIHVSYPPREPYRVEKKKKENGNEIVNAMELPRDREEGN